jgi:hypothetical protein
MWERRLMEIHVYAHLNIFIQNYIFICEYANIHSYIYLYAFLDPADRERHSLGIVVEGGLGTTLDGDRWAQASPKAMNIRYRNIYLYIDIRVYVRIVYVCIYIYIPISIRIYVYLFIYICMCTRI